MVFGFSSEQNEFNLGADYAFIDADSPEITCLISRKLTLRADWFEAEPPSPTKSLRHGDNKFQYNFGIPGLKKGV